MMKNLSLLFLFLFVFLSSCSSNEEREEELPPELIHMNYVPIQCVNEAWENWYEQSDLEFSKEPNDEEKIKLFLKAEYNIEVYSLDKRVITDYVCNRGCALCPEGFYYLIVVEKTALDTMKALNWRTVLTLQV